jgi:Ca2+/H+ antiporter
MALSHVLGASVQTALLNSSIAVIVGWGLSTHANGSGNHAIGMDLDFRSFEAIVLILAILVVGNFLRDGKVCGLCGERGGGNGDEADTFNRVIIWRVASVFAHM